MPIIRVRSWLVRSGPSTESSSLGRESSSTGGEQREPRLSIFLGCKNMRDSKLKATPKSTLFCAGGAFLRLFEPKKPRLTPWGLLVEDLFFHPGVLRRLTSPGLCFLDRKELLDPNWKLRRREEKWVTFPHFRGFTDCSLGTEQVIMF